MKFYLCYPYALSKKQEQRKSRNHLPIRVSDRTFHHFKQLVMRINLVIFFIAIAIFKVTASVNAQNISLKFQNAPIEKVFSAIEKQSSYIFWYDKSLLKNTSKVNLKITNGNLKEALDQCFKDQPLEYEIVDNTIVVKKKEKQQKKIGIDFFNALNISGKILDENGQPLPGAAIKVKGTALAATSDNIGNFSMPNAPDNSVLVISYLGYETKEITATSTMTISLSRSTSKLDEVQVMAYGTTTQRLSTSSISKVSSAEIEKQPVSNPLAALIGRVPGLIVTQNSGLPGSNFTVQIRGRTSIANSSDPLYLIDGVPFNAATLDKINSQSPLNSINPLDIESIEVLKDADATAIYGSRGANGVILITTKKGKAGKTQISANAYSGAGEVTRTMDYLNTEQYLEMRREAFKNDGITPTAANAPDLLVWDNNRYTDWRNLLIGGTARTTDMQVNLSGGSENTQFLIGTNYHRETTVYPGDMSDTKGNVHFNLTHRSIDNKFNASLSASYNNDNNNLIAVDLTSVMNLTPNSPNPFDENGNLNWQENGVSFKNPLAYLLQPLKNRTDNLISNAFLKYTLVPDLNISTNLGFTNTYLKQTQLRPKSSFDPNGIETSSAIFANNNAKTWIIEPQAEYTKRIGDHKLNFLLGATWQQDGLDGQRINATNFSSDALMESPAAAASLATTFNYSKYRYQAFFSRINYNYKDRYILNLTGRRDGSSRFGPGKQFANFGAVGAAWIFTQEDWLKDNFKVLSFGKIRGSYGITGNDKIGDYKYLDTYYLTSSPYQGSAGLIPGALSNPNYAWEENKKFELAMDLGFFKDRILLNSSYYRNRSGNQLVAYALPSQTGFSSIFQNFPALVQNSGWEFSLSTINIKSVKFNWTSNINISFAQNELLEFPGLETSTYATQYVIGYPLNIQRSLQYLGVDPQTGIYQFSSTNITSDRNYINDLTPKFYGGVQNTLIYKGFQLDFFFQFAKQKGANFLAVVTGTAPGNMVNQPVYMIDRWQNVNDQAKVQKFTTLGTSGAAGQANQLYTTYSDARFSDASFIRLKNVNISYSLPKEVLSKIKVSNLRLFLQGQNLFTITNYLGNDPESGSVSNNYLPPLRVLTAGLQLTY